MEKEKLKAILDAHKAWLESDKEGKMADLQGADLREADLREADLDFAVWPLWCGGLKVETDAGLMRQLAYHFCAQECNDPEYLAARNAILPFANKFRRAEECGVLEPIDPVNEEMSRC